ncbi:hypothetical protein LTR66_000943 [Elasticomyces elasticus]|nr:hypothetical protein LTR28_003238 [Elasticomyces elasticus]KAK5000170.1 hypothetical protein LTR66_000943 [Elasticomyces elasticus]
MDSEDLMPMIDELSTQITALENTLTPMLSAALSTTASKLPLLDKAKLHILTTYAIESLLFSYIKLANPNEKTLSDKSHSIFTEIARVKQYFHKAKTAENAAKPEDKKARLDKAAAGRFVKHALSGNEKLEQERIATQEMERQRAKRKFEEMEGSVGRSAQLETRSTKGKVDKMRSASRIFTSAGKEKETLVSPEDEEKSLTTQAGPEASRAEQKRIRREERAKQRQLEQTEPSSGVTSSAQDTETIVPAKPQQAPRGPNEAFQALLKGPLPKADGKKPKKSRREKQEEKRLALEEERAQEMR